LLKTLDREKVFSKRTFRKLL